MTRHALLMALGRHIDFKLCTRSVRLSRVLIIFISTLFMGGVTACSETEPVVDHTRTPQALKAHSATFEQAVLKVSDRVHVAIGFGLANSIMIEGDDGLIIVDTMETVEEGKAVMAAFRKISDKPVKAIIYTHNHADHVFGSQAFAEGHDVDVYAHESTAYYIGRVINIIRPIITTRSMRMFGNHLHQDELVNAGIGPHLTIHANSTLNALAPTKTFKDTLKTTIAGVNIELIHAPGETEDQLFVWLPDDKVLMPGDNIYKTFPNLYTIRGTYYRDVTKWINSLDLMRQMPAEHIVPSHTRPVSGHADIQKILTDYRDAIQYVHDQTIRYMNQGLSPDDIVEKVKLPARLANNPYLHEFYGTVEWSVRSIFTGYLGWFDGNSTSLQPLPKGEEARKMVELAGGEQALLNQVQEAMSKQEYQWVLQLCDYLLHTGESQAAKHIKSAALFKLAESESNPNARHYYFTQAKELKSNLKAAIYPKPNPAFLAQLPTKNIFQSMPVYLKAEDTLDVLLTVQFNLTDTNETYSIQIRHGIAEVQNYPISEPDVTITTTAQVWKEVSAKIKSPINAVINGELAVSSGKLALVEFLSYFDVPDFSSE